VLTFTGVGKIRIILGESVSETLSNIGEHNATNDHATRDATFGITNYSDMSFMQSGFRFARIVIVEGESIAIKSIVAVSVLADIPIKNHYQTNDRELQKIYDTAVHTLHLCIQNNMIWDGIKRDRLVWMGDIYPELIACKCLYDDLSFIENSLEFLISQTPPEGWFNGIPQYTLWFIIVMAEYRGHNAKFVTKHIDYIEKVMHNIVKFGDENGRTHYPFNFVDWPTHDTEDEIYGVEALHLWALQEGKKMLGKRGEFIRIPDINSYRPYKGKFKQIAALRRFVEIKNDTLNLAENGGAGLSTFMSYFILNEIKKSHGIERALAILKEYYGGMLKVGATTFWEDFNIKWLQQALPIDELPDGKRQDIRGEYGQFCYTGFRHSLCHGWSAGIIKFMFEAGGAGKPPIAAGMPPQANSVPRRQ